MHSDHLRILTKLDDKRLLKTDEVADLFGVAPRTICEWVEIGKLPGFKLGRQWRFRAASIHGWLSGREADGTADAAYTGDLKRRSVGGIY